MFKKMFNKNVYVFMFFKAKKKCWLADGNDLETARIWRSACCRRRDSDLMSSLTLIRVDVTWWLFIDRNAASLICAVACDGRETVEKFVLSGRQRFTHVTRWTVADLNLLTRVSTAWTALTSRHWRTGTICRWTLDPTTSQLPSWCAQCVS